MDPAPLRGESWDLEMSRLLFTMCQSIDHVALLVARARVGDMVTDGASDSQDGEPPGEITMQDILVDTLQYLQLIVFGIVTSPNANDYTHEELIVNLRRVLDAADEVGEAVSEEVAYLQDSAERVLLLLQYGVTPIEPIAWLHGRSYATAWCTPADPLYEGQDQHQHPGTYVSESTMFFRARVRVPTEAGLERRFRAPPNPSNDGGWSPLTASGCSSNDEEEEPVPVVNSPSPSCCSITPSESVTNVPSARDRARARHRRRLSGSISPVESNCSILPNDSLSGIMPWIHASNHETWAAHPYRTDRYDENLPPLRNIPGTTDYVHAVDERQQHTSAVGSATMWTDIRSDIRRANAALGGSYMVVPTPPEASNPNHREQQPETSQSLESLESVYHSAVSQLSSSSTTERSVAGGGGPRLAMGMGSLGSRLRHDATEGERMEFAFDEIDRLIDQWMAEK